MMASGAPVSPPCHQLVALTSTEGAGTKGGIGVFFAGVGVGAQAAKNTTKWGAPSRR